MPISSSDSVHGVKAANGFRRRLPYRWLHLLIWRPGYGWARRATGLTHIDDAALNGAAAGHRAGYQGPADNTYRHRRATPRARSSTATGAVSLAPERLKRECPGQGRGVPRQPGTAFREDYPQLKALVSGFFQRIMAETGSCADRAGCTAGLGLDNVRIDVPDLLIAPVSLAFRAAKAFRGGRNRS